jgi:hypothetical protein
MPRTLLRLSLFWMSISLTIMLQSSALASTATPMRFDLICAIRGHTYVKFAADRMQEPGYLGPPKWAFTTHYVIDLKRRLYWATDWVDVGLGRLQSVGPIRVYLTKSEGYFQRINLKTNQYYARGEGEGFVSEVSTGRCHRAPFSGFPPGVRAR